MIITRRLFLVSSLLLGSSAIAASQELRTDQIAVQYVEPKTEGLRPVYDLVRKAEALEKVQYLLAPLRLPRRLTMRMEDCGGTSNAWYEDDAVTICYEFLDDIWKNAQPQTTASGVAPIDTLLGPLIDVFLHEVGHAVFDYLKIPIFGREEDAADQFSLYIMLQFPKDEARRLILGNAYQYRGDVRFPVTVNSSKKFADVHGTPSQRYFNVLCIAYGADPKLFADFVKQKYLPDERAEGCEYEYQQMANAFTKLIAPYINQDLAKNRHSGWLPSVDKRPVLRSDKGGWRRLFDRQ